VASYHFLMDLIKEAFKKVREDMDSLVKEIFSLRIELTEVKEELKRVTREPPSITQIPTNPQINPVYPKEIPTHNPPYNALKPQNLGISTGNQGVPTDKQTNRQTDTQHINQGETTPFLFPLQEKTKENVIDNAAMILESLDNIKKEIRLKFKRLTDQEILVFSALYQLDEEQGHTEYRTLAQRLGLSESSIRDYVGRLIKKGIPVEKKKINNKTIHLSVSANLKKIATLQTILQLRDI